MKNIRIYLLVVVLIVLFSLQVTSAFAGPSLAPTGTSFTYQGELLYQGALANGSFDFQFSLHDASGGGAQVGGMITKSSVTVTEGRFTVSLDFGSGVFAGDARWLEIAVRTAGGSGYTTLTPRQELTPAPYAIHASSVDGLPAVQATQAALDTRLTLLENTVGDFIYGNKSGSCIGIATDTTPVECTISMGAPTLTAIASPVSANDSELHGFIDGYFTGDNTIDYTFYGPPSGTISIAVNWIAIKY